MKLAKRMEKLAPEGAFKVLAEAQALEREGQSIIHFEIGQPDFRTPQNISQAAIKSIENGETKYTPSLGIWSFREAIAKWTTTHRNVKTLPDEVAVTPSCKTALFTALAAVVEQGDEVLYPDPGFPAYKILTEFFGGKAVAIPLVEERAFSFDMRVFRKKISKKTRAVILNYPSNPTGTIIPKEDLNEIASLAKRFKTWIITDEIYNRILYTDTEYLSMYSLPSMKKQTIIVDGFSKTYSMTGWRLGWLVAPKTIMERIDYFLTHSIACTATFTQLAGIEALEGPQQSVSDMVSQFRKRRDFVIAELNKIAGVHCFSPHGAFYVFPNVSSFKKSSAFLAKYILEKAGVALLDGTAFGACGEGYIRISYATSMKNLQIGLKKIRTSLEKLQ